MKRLGMLIIIIVLWQSLAGAQSEGPNVQRYLALVNAGKADEVRLEIPGLLSKHPNDPGVLYLQAVCTTEGAEAVRIYQSIVDNFPGSEWADDALYKVYQFYYALGLYRTAELKMNQLTKDYPASKYLSAAAGPEAQELPEEREQASATDTSRPVALVPATAPATVPSSGFTLQMGAYTAQVNAERQKKFFEDLGHTVEVINRVKDNRTLFLVMVGSFPTAEEARAAGEEIRKKYNINSMVIAR
jgi:cell division septation protein DedD